MRALTPKTLDFLDEAPVRTRIAGTVSAPPSEVFAVLADDARWPRWCSAFKGCRSLPGMPQGKGYGRYVDAGWLKVEERFIVWEPGKAWFFTLTRGNTGVFRAFVEGAALEPADDGRTAIVWRIGLRPAWYLRPLSRLIQRMNDRAVSRLIGELDAECLRRFAKAPAAAG